MNSLFFRLDTKEIPVCQGMPGRKDQGCFLSATTSLDKLSSAV